MNRTSVSRRAFLARMGQLSTAAAAASIIAACGGPAATEQPPAAPAPTTAPAADAPTTAAEAPPAATSAPAAGQVNLVMANFGAIPDEWVQFGELFTQDNPDIKVTFEGVQANTWGEYFDKLITQFASGTQPDLVRVAIEGTQLFAHRGLAVPIDSYIERDAADLEEYFTDINDNMRKSMAYLGKQYMLPFTWNGPVIHYNTKLFEEAGIARPADDWSKDDFLAVAQQLTKDDVFGFAIANAFWGSTIPWIFVADGDILNADWTESTTNSPNTVEAVQFMRDLIWEYKVSPNPAGADLLQMFSSGKLAMYAGGGNTRLAVINNGMTDFDVIYYPKWRSQTHEYGGSGFPILKSSPNPDAAWLLIKFMLSRENIASFVQKVAQTPARRSVAYDDWVTAGQPPEHFKVYYDMLDKPARSVPAPPEYNEIESIFLRYFSLVSANEQEPQAAMDAAHEEIAQVLANRTPPAA